MNYPDKEKRDSLREVKRQADMFGRHLNADQLYIAEMNNNFISLLDTVDKLEEENENLNKQLNVESDYQAMLRDEIEEMEQRIIDLKSGSANVNVEEG